MDSSRSSPHFDLWVPSTGPCGRNCARLLQTIVCSPFNSTTTARRKPEKGEGWQESGQKGGRTEREKGQTGRRVEERTEGLQGALLALYRGQYPHLLSSHLTPSSLSHPSVASPFFHPSR
jgi:hypothetical protein